RTIADLDARGESGALTPDYRAKVTDAKREWKLAVGDVRDMRVELFGTLGRELHAFGCRDDLMAAALVAPVARPPVPPADPAPIAPPAAAAAAPPTPARATFYVDNRECPDTVTVWIDGEKIGVVPGGERSALTAVVGRRTMCLMEPGGGNC